MPKYLFPILVMLSFLKPTCGFAEGATKVDDSCRQQRKDSFDLGWRFGRVSQSYAGRCLDTQTMRPAKILVNSRSEMQFANFYHEGQYWIAKWNKNLNRPKVQYFGVHFDSGIAFIKAGHTELHFIFPKSIELVSQTTGEHKSTRNVVITWQAVFPPEVEYNLMIGLQPNFALAGRVLSLDARIPENILPDGTSRPIDVYDLNLTSTESAFLFQESVRESDYLAFKHFYLTLDLNCTSMLFDLVDEVLTMMDPKRMIRVARFKTNISADPILGPGHDALIVRRLITPLIQPAGADPDPTGSGGQ